MNTKTFLDEHLAVVCGHLTDDDLMLGIQNHSSGHLYIYIYKKEIDLRLANTSFLRTTKSKSTD
jgi:hypothetical protein